MIQRSGFVVAAAATLILAPGAALAHAGQDHQAGSQSRQDKPKPQPARQGSHDNDNDNHGNGNHGNGNGNHGNGNHGNGNHGNGNHGNGNHGHHGHYEADDFDVTESDPTPECNRREMVFLHGARANERVTLTITSPRSKFNRDIEIAGTKSLVRTANAQGVATFAVTFAAAGVYPVTMTNASGEVLGTNTLTAVPASAAPAVPATPELSAVGFAGVGLAVGGTGLVLAGAGAVLVARRRRLTGATT